MELCKRAAGVNAVHVPYRGGAPALQDVVAGNVQVMIAALAEAMPLVKRSGLRARAVTSPDRSPRYPDLPKVSSVRGMEGFKIYLWYSMVVPAATPSGIAVRLNDAISAVLNEPELRDRLAGLDIEVEGCLADHLAGIVRDEGTKWKGVIDEASIRLD